MLKNYEKKLRLFLTVWMLNIIKTRFSLDLSLNHLPEAPDQPTPPFTPNQHPGMGQNDVINPMVK